MSNITTGVISGALTRSEFGESDIDSYFENNTAVVQARVVNLRVNTQAVDGSSLIFGNAAEGIWGTGSWSAGLTTPFIRTREDFMWIDYDDSFSTAEYGNRAYNDLIGYLDFDNNVNDISGNNFNGSIGGATIGINNGVHGRCLSFNLGGSVVLPYVLSANLSASLWFKPDAVSASDRNLFAFQKSLLRFNNTGFKWFPDIDGIAYEANATITTSSWHHVAISQVGANYSIYYNGNLVTAGVGSIIDTGNLYNFIGYYPGGINYSGSLDEFLLSKRGITAAEVNHLYNNGFANTYFTPVSGWGTGSIIFTNISNSNNILFTTGSSMATVTVTSGSIQLV